MVTQTVTLASFAGPGYAYSFVDKSGATIEKIRSSMEVRIIAPVEPGDYPVVFWSHGHNSNPSGGGGSDTRAIADQGYIVIVPTHLDSLDNPDQANNFGDQFPVDDPASTLGRIADLNFLLQMGPQLINLLNLRTAGGYSGDFSKPTIAGHSHGAFVAQLLTGVESGNPAFQGLANPAFTQAILVSPQGNQAEAVFGLFDNGPTSHSWRNASSLSD